MSMNAKVVWSEGMFLRPQHFQQQDRYIERLIDRRCKALNGYGWGLSVLEIDQQLLSLGKLSILRAEGVFQDGTPFSIPEVDESPAILEVPENLKNTTLYLAIALQRSGAPEVSQSNTQQGLARYISVEYQTRDSVSELGEFTNIDVGKLGLRLLLEHEDRSGYATLGIARILESKPDKRVILDERFVPTCIDINLSPKLKGFLTELSGLLSHRAESLRGRLSDINRAGAAEVADYMLLQLINRLEPLMEHLASAQGLHPERLYTELIQVAGELSTFMATNRRPVKLKQYMHDYLQETFTLPIQLLREYLSTVIEQNAISLELVECKYGIRVSPITDRSLIYEAQFILAVKSDLPTESVRQQFPAHIKIAPVEQIRELVNAQMPGIALTALPVAPRQLPFHTGFVYFELDDRGDLWQLLKKSGGLAFHFGAQYPGLQLALWAIRR